MNHKHQCEIVHANGLPVSGWMQDLLKCWYTDMHRQKFALKHLDVLKHVVDLLICWYARMIEKHSTYYATPRPGRKHGGRKPLLHCAWVKRSLPVSPCWIRAHWAPVQRSPSATRPPRVPAPRTQWARWSTPWASVISHIINMCWRLRFVSRMMGPSQANHQARKYWFHHLTTRWLLNWIALALWLVILCTCSMVCKGHIYGPILVDIKIFWILG